MTGLLYLGRRLIVFLLAGVVWCCSGERSEGVSVSLSIQRAIAVGGGSGFRRVARIKLGCTPCSEVTVEHIDGGQITYLYSESSPIEIQPRDISGFHLTFDDGVFLLTAQLDPMHVKLIRENAELGFEQGANFVGRSFVDVVPLKAPGSYYLIGAFDTREEARVVADQLGATTIEENNERI